MALLERSDELALLTERWAAVRRERRGRLVLVSGEAGVGKTALVREFCADVPALSGACEALFTPRPLGPLLDIAAQAGGEAAEVAGGAPTPARLLEALADQVRGAIILVLEDLHWADEATLDALRLLARRLATLPALVLATHRDDELHRAHPLRLVLGELSPGPIDRLRLQPLTKEAVAVLAADAGVDGARLHERTGGNPFYVTEVLAEPGGGTPATVRDAVLARTARLSGGARRLLEAVAVVPPRAEFGLLEVLAGPDLTHLEACLASGVLQSHGNAVGFRHEIARVAIEESLPPDRRVALHRTALAKLTGRADPARLAHHAEAAEDAPAVLAHATAAGERASRLKAHREAAEQFARALRHAEGLGPEERAGLFERRAYECYLTDRIPEAIEARQRALEAYREAADPLKEGDTLRWLSRLHWFSGDNERAEEAGRRAVALLESLPPGPELAMALSNLAQLRMLAYDVAGAVRHGGRAIALAERLGEPEILAHALNNVGAAEVRAGIEGGRGRLERSLAIALDAGLEEHVARAYTNLGSLPVQAREPALGAEQLEAGLAYCLDHDLDAWRWYMGGWYARAELDRGHWDRASDLATAIVERPGVAVPSRITPLVVIGLLRARRGDPDPWRPLDEALELARRTGELQRLGPVAAARAEACWLAGTQERIASETEAALDLARAAAEPWLAGELLTWRRRAGVDESCGWLPAEPFLSELEGDHRGAAAAWARRGCPYEGAVALAAGDEADLRRSHQELQRLGARATARLVARRLRERGARDVRRGPRSATRTNPAGLTGRELEVLALIAAGHRNAEIAARLFLSEKTVGHHVSAILRKLGVRSRGEAGVEAVRLGLTGER
jgi:DNA-binding CsgD family transcriptional regulator/tetratricopeptide (TPR) repeat protein